MWSRSPWSNTYFPPLDDGFVPDARLRAMEIEANKIFDIYRKQYFEGGYSSVYFFDTEAKDDKSFGACFLIHKGQLNSTHTAQADERAARPPPAHRRAASRQPPDDSRARQQGVARRLPMGALRQKS